MDALLQHLHRVLEAVWFVVVVDLPELRYRSSYRFIIGFVHLAQHPVVADGLRRLLRHFLEEAHGPQPAHVLDKAAQHVRFRPTEWSIYRLRSVQKAHWHLLTLLPNRSFAHDSLFLSLSFDTSTMTR